MKFLYGCLKFEGLKVEFGFPSMGDPVIPPGLGLLNHQTSKISIYSILDENLFVGV
jgi:hypothetical protein